MYNIVFYFYNKKKTVTIFLHDYEKKNYHDILDEIHLNNISNFLTPSNYWFAKRKRWTKYRVS